jgi:hypothetical protein
MLMRASPFKLCKHAYRLSWSELYSFGTVHFPTVEVGSLHSLTTTKIMVDKIDLCLYSVVSISLRL